MRHIKSIILLLASLNLFSISHAADNNNRFAINHWITAQGAQVFFLPSSDLPIIDIRVAFAAGAARDGKRRGLATLTNQLLNQGTRAHNADQIAEGFERVGAIYGNQVARDMAILSLRSLSDEALFKKALKLFSEVIASPGFPAVAFQRERNNQLTALQEELQSPAHVATRQFYQTLYNKHPYANPVLGESKTLARLSRSHVKDFYERYYSAQNATIAIVGNIDVKQAKQIAKKISKKLKIGRIAPPLENLTPAVQETKKSIAFPAKQTNIRLGQLGISRHSTDYFPLMVGNYVLGGGSLVSRLFDEVREKRGLSYSTYSQFIPMAAKGPFIISLGTRNDQAEKALSVTQNVLKKFIDHGPTAAEINAAKKNIIGGFALRLDSNRALADNLISIGFYQLPLDYLSTYRNKIKSVTSKQVHQAFKRHIKPQQMVIVNVGNKATTKKQ